MNQESNKSSPPPFEGSLQNTKDFIKSKVYYLNGLFNSLSLNAKRASLIVFGISTACTCGMLIINALSGQANMDLKVDKITVPNDTTMNEPKTETLTPLGKIKGEIDGEFEAFHVAIDREGHLFINRDPEFSKDSLNKSKGWEPITRQQLEAYEIELHFIPSQKKGLKR